MRTRATSIRSMPWGAAALASLVAMPASAAEEGSGIEAYQIDRWMS